MSVTNLAPMALIAAILALGACDRTRPILDIHNEPVPTAARAASIDVIGRRIELAAATLHWRTMSPDPGHIVATIDAKDHEATVDIIFTNQGYGITLKSSTNLLQSADGTINKRYDSWVTNLRNQIDLQLASYVPPRS